MKHTLYITNSIEEIDETAEKIGEIEKWSEIWKIANPIISARGYHQEPYHRQLFCKDATYIDFGSWSKFLAIQPPFALEELTAEN